MKGITGREEEKNKTKLEPTRSRSRKRISWSPRLEEAHKWKGGQVSLPIVWGLRRRGGLTGAAVLVVPRAITSGLVMFLGKGLLLG